VTRARHRRIVGAPWISLLEVVLDHAPQLNGACSGRAPDFDGDDGPDGELTRAAIAECHRCCALEDCCRWVASLPRYRVPAGVLAGVYR
jgi:WhiB family redox-sensing transcriptional regulator